MIAIISILAISWYIYDVVFIESQPSRTVAPLSTEFVRLPSGEVIAYQILDNHAPVTVLFVGGLSAWNGTWERTMQSLNRSLRDYNYIALDLPPFGYSYSENRERLPYFRPNQAERISSFMKMKSLDQVILVAHSYGAGPSAELILNGNKRVKKFVIIDGVLNIDETKSAPPKIIDVGWLRQGLIGILVHNHSFAKSRLKSFAYKTDIIDDALLAIYTRYFNTRGITGKFSDWLYDYLHDPLTYRSTQSKNYRDIAIPVRIIWGDHDTLTPIELAKPLLENIPDSQLFTLEGVGHMPMIEDYAKFDTALLKALQP